LVIRMLVVFILFFFFQAEDGIRVFHVTGVQTCALPIWIESKSGVKQVDRLLSNKGVALETLMPLWIRHVVGTTSRIALALDWMDFDGDDHTTLCAYLVTTHGRAMPLAWQTVKKSTLKAKRTGYELDLIRRLHKWLPENIEVTLLADRGFGYAELYDELSWL